MNNIQEILDNVLTDKLIDDVSKTYKNFSTENIMDILPTLITFADRFKTLAGCDKKELVISLLNKIIDKTDGPGNDELLDPILKKLVPSIIDTLIKVDNKTLKLKQAKNCLKCIPKKK